jgi:hypothetical protein
LITRLEAAGYPVVLHVHDEVVCELLIGQCSLDEFKRLVETVPEWAAGLPIAAKVRESLRFSKSDAPPIPPRAPVTPEAAPPVTPAGIPFMITHAMKEDLRDLGFTDDQIANLTPAEAHAIMATQAVPETPPTPPEPPQKPAVQPPPSPQPKAPPTPERPAKGRGKGNGKYPCGEEEIGDATDEWIYRNVRNQPYLKVVKYVDYEGGKQYPQYRIENGRWVKGAPGGPTIPYRLPELLDAPAGAPVWICEGEKCVEAVRGLGLIATCNPGGAEKWKSELNKWLDGFPVAYVLADNDDPGRRHVHKVASSLRNAVPNVHIVSFRELRDNDHDGYDVADWIEDGGTREELLERASEAAKFAPLESVCAADEEMRDIDWVWPNRFALGKIALIAGLPDEGKGLLISYMMSTVSRGGTWPCGEGVSPQGNIILMSAEDDVNDTIVPRLEAAGADRKRIHIIKMMREPSGGPRLFSLITDLEALRLKIEEVGNVKLVIIDPISSYLGIGQIDSFRSTDVRAVLSPLKDLAEELRVAVIGIMHFNKKIDITNVLLRVSDSLAFGAAARHVYGVVDDEDNKRKLFVKGKNNIASRDLQPTLAYSFAAKPVGVDARNGKPITAPYIIWSDAPVDVTALEAMQAAAESKSPGARDHAKWFLKTLLAEEPVSAADVQEAAKENGISRRTLFRAKSELGIEAKKDGAAVNGETAWRWHPPKKAPSTQPTEPTQPAEPTRPNGDGPDETGRAP